MKSIRPPEFQLSVPRCISKVQQRTVSQTRLVPRLLHRSLFSASYHRMPKGESATF